MARKFQAGGAFKPPRENQAPRSRQFVQTDDSWGPTLAQSGVNGQILVSLEPLVGLWCQRRPQIQVYSTFHKSRFSHDLLAKQGGPLLLHVAARLHFAGPPGVQGYAPEGFPGRQPGPRNSGPSRPRVYFPKRSQGPFKATRRNSTCPSRGPTFSSGCHPDEIPHFQIESQLLQTPHESKSYTVFNATLPSMQYCLQCNNISNATLSSMRHCR